MATKRSKSSELYFTRYKNSKLAEANRKRKLERQLKLQPGNEKQISLAIKNIRYRRHTPKVHEWSPTKRAVATIMKTFVGVFDKNVLSNEFEVQVAAAKVRKEAWFTNTEEIVPKYKSMYCLANRAHDGRGNLLWAQ